MKKMLINFKYGNKTIYRYKNFSIAVVGYDLYFTIYNNNIIIFENITNKLICYNIKYINIILEIFRNIDKITIID